MTLNPKEEWNQIFNDTWRRYRDFFYDPAMQQVDWNDVRKQYGCTHGECHHPLGCYNDSTGNDR